MFASYGDLAFDLLGYSLTALNCLTTALYLVIINAKSTETGLSTFSLMYYNNLLCAPLVILFIVLFEWDIVTQYEGYYDIGFQVIFKCPIL
jgi:solute carrier family 35